MPVVHVDNDLLVLALSRSGPERRLLLELADGGTELGISSIAWYEFQRGPRTAEQTAVAETLLIPVGVVPFTREAADIAAALYKTLRKPRKRVADLAIASVAIAGGAALATANVRHFGDIPGLRLLAPTKR